MKKLFTLFLVILLIITFYSCHCPDENEEAPGRESVNDKQIRFRFNFYTGQNWYGDSSGTVLNYYSIIKFNINNYPNVDSAIFVAKLGIWDSSNFCFADLYNLTDNVKISNSTLKTNSRTSIYVQSMNIVSSFPKKEITLSIYLRSQKPTTIQTPIHIEEGYVFLFRK
jgi:hypothetical protein